MAEQAQCAVETVGARSVVTVTGQIDVATAPQLADALARCTGDDVRVDVSGVTFLDSSGLSVLVRAQNDAEERNGHLAIDGASAALLRIFEITGLINELRVNGALPERPAQTSSEV